MMDLQTLSLPETIQRVSCAYRVPQRAILADLQAVSRHPVGIGPMGIPPVWLSRLARAGFRPAEVKTIPQWNIAAGAWILAQELRGTTRQAPVLQAVWHRHPVRHLVRDLDVAARVSGVPASLLAAVMMQESGGDPAARSPKGAMGLMQLMPGTATTLGVRNPWNPRQNLLGGAEYLAMLLREFHNNPVFALAAYNAGPQAVEHYRGIPPYPQTQAYVPAVLEHYHWLQSPSSRS